MKHYTEATLRRIHKYFRYFTTYGKLEAAKMLNIDVESLTRDVRKYREYYREREQLSMKAPKILLLDIETAPMEVYVWDLKHNEYISPNFIIKDWNAICYVAKWLCDSKYLGHCQTPQEAKNRDDKRVLKSVWKLLDESDVIIGHNCVEVNTPVLKQDLTWVPAGDLKKGDKIVGFEEATIPSQSFRDETGKWNGTKAPARAIRPTEVLGNKIEEQECCEVSLSNGDKIITTLDHYWLGKTKKDNFYKWLKTKDLKPGYRFTKFWNVWDKEDSYTGGWLSGFLAGEGSFNQSHQQFGIHFYQRPGSTWDKAVRLFQEIGFQTSEHTQRANGIGRQDTKSGGILGGKFETAELIGRLRIERFLEKIDWYRFGGLKGKNLDTVDVVSVESVGERKVAVMSTSEKTFFAGGYAMHNCDRFDLRKLNARFIKHGLPQPSPYRVIDTLKHSRKVFAFSSHKQDYITKFLNLPEKLETNFDLWKRCIAGDKAALKEMFTYCQHDVGGLEEFYLKLRPWMKQHPNLGTFCDGNVCHVCMSKNLVKNKKYYTTNTNLYQSFRCKDCGAYSHEPYGKLTLRQRQTINRPG